MLPEDGTSKGLVVGCVFVAAVFVCAGLILALIGVLGV